MRKNCGMAARGEGKITRLLIFRRFIHIVRTYATDAQLRTYNQSALHTILYVLDLLLLSVQLPQLLVFLSRSFNICNFDICLSVLVPNIHLASSSSSSPPSSSSELSTSDVANIQITD